MRALLTAFLVAGAATANAATIFPAGGAVTQTPTLYITANQMPRIEVTDKGGPVQFEIAEEVVEGPLRQIALRPSVADGPFTVTLDGKPIRFEADAGLDRASEDDFFYVEFVRLATERIRGRDTLVIDARAEPGTILYFLNHSRPDRANDNVFARYLWVGPGRAVGEGVKRYEVPLSALHVSCGSTATVELSPYTTHVGGGPTTLYPIATLELARGKVHLPVNMLEYDMKTEWQPCSGAFEVQPPKSPAHESEHAANAERLISLAPAAAVDVTSCPGLLGSDVPSSMAPATDDGEVSPWWLVPLSLAGIALVLWRTTTRVAA